MSTFDIKKFLINEGMTRVSRDRKKLLKEGFEEGADLAKRILDVIQQDDELGQVLEVRPGHQWEDVIGDWEPDEVTVETEHGSDDPMQVEPGKYVFVDGDFKWNLEDEVGEEIPWTYYIWYSGPTASYVTYMYRLPETEDEDDYVDGDDDYPWDELEAELDEEVNHEVATRYRNITMADPKNADSTKSARNTQHGSTSHHYTGLGSANQDAEHRKEQSKQNANLKKQLGIKTKPMSREDWITKKLNKELGL